VSTLAASSAGQLPVDKSWFLDVNRFAHATPWLHAPMRDYAQYGVVLFAVLLLGAWWTARGRRDLAGVAAALWAPLGMLLAVGLNQPLGSWVHEARPSTSLPHVSMLVARSSDFSFPSDHAVMAGAVAAGVWLANRRLGMLAALAALVMAFARVYVGAHYPGDVLAGLLFGAAVTLAGYAVARLLLRMLVAALAGTPLRPLVTAAASDRPAQVAVTR
jgi:membrane-associated phospholipid phosphatase